MVMMAKLMASLVPPSSPLKCFTCVENARVRLSQILLSAYYCHYQSIIGLAEHVHCEIRPDATEKKMKCHESSINTGKHIYKGIFARSFSPQMSIRSVAVGRSTYGFSLYLRMLQPKLCVWRSCPRHLVSCHCLGHQQLSFNCTQTSFSVFSSLCSTFFLACFFLKG